MPPQQRRRSKPPTTARTPTRSQSVRETGVKKKPGLKKNVSSTQVEEDGTQMEQRTQKKKGNSVRKRRVSIGTVSADKTEGDQQTMKAVLRQFALATVEKGVNGLVTEFTDLKLTTSAPPAKIAFDGKLIV